MNSRFLLELSLKHPPDPAAYYSALPVLQWLSRGNRLPLDAPVTILVGENGTGKSTLLEALAVAAGFNPEGGTRNFSFSSKETHSGLWQNIRLIRGTTRPKDGFFLRAESFYNVATEVEKLQQADQAHDLLQYYGGRSLHERSHGESFLALMIHRFSGDGLYLLDEPEAALSPSRQLALLARLGALARAGSQFIIATHSPLVMAYPGASLYLLEEGGARPVSYQETEHYQITRRFLENPQRMLSYLLEEEQH